MFLEIHSALVLLPVSRGAHLARLPRAYRRRDLHIPDDEPLLGFVAKYPSIFSLRHGPICSSSALAAPDGLKVP